MEVRGKMLASYAQTLNISHQYYKKRAEVVGGGRHKLSTDAG